MPGQVARCLGAAPARWSCRTRHRAARTVAVLGMGGSAIGGDLVRGIWSDRLRVPLEVVRGYDLPAWVGRDTLVVASSYSGATEETISAFDRGHRARRPVAVISTGGAAPRCRAARRSAAADASRAAGSRARRWATP